MPNTTACRARPTRLPVDPPSELQGRKVHTEAGCGDSTTLPYDPEAPDRFGIGQDRGCSLRASFGVLCLTGTSLRGPRTSPKPPHRGHTLPATWPLPPQLRQLVKTTSHHLLPSNLTPTFASKPHRSVLETFMSPSVFGDRIIQLFRGIGKCFSSRRLF